MESYWPSLFAKLAAKRNIGNLLLNVGCGGGAAAPVAVAAPTASAAVVPPIKEKRVCG